ncbi:MAG: molybdenum cofactor guanylyltransferase [Burkholderiales bacterium]|nr:molybdenum cofactor guanylyltransferase [Burkholderiales bacterium]
MTPAERTSITGLILAGGRSSRMSADGAKDKALAEFRGKRLIDHVFERFAPQVGGVMINANRNHDKYKGFGVRVVSDAIGDFAGPLAGLHAGLSASRRPYLVTVPCDSPFFPEDLVERMFDALNSTGTQLAVAMSGEQPHPVFALVRRSVLDHLSEFLKGGGRKIDAWYDTLKTVQVDFNDDALFGNINTPEELEAFDKGLPPPPRKAKPRFRRDATTDQPDAPAAAAIDVTDIIPDTPAAAGGASAPDSLAALVSCLDAYDPNALPVSKVNEVIRRFVRRVDGVEQVAVRAGLDRVLAHDIISPINVPAHDNSAMDGWAVRASDLSASQSVALSEIGAALAGREFVGKVSRGECVRITTGAVMPHGCDTVVPLEIVKVEGKAIHIPPGLEAGTNRRFAGEDLARGSAALKAGKRLGPAELGLIASLGIPEVRVRRRLRVAFFSTGDELKSVGESLAEGEVYDSNRYTLYGMLARLGVDFVDMGVVRDDPALLEAAFRTAARDADAVITSGGVSVGEADHTRHIMARLGEVVFWRIAMRPGRPMAFGRIAAGDRSAILFGLPGNPVAVMVTFYHFVRGALLHMMGRDDLDLPLLSAISTEPMRKKPGRTEYQRGILELRGGSATVRTTGQQGSGVLRSMSEANCFIVLEHDQGNIKAGDLVKVMLFDGLA